MSGDLAEDDASLFQAISHALIGYTSQHFRAAFCVVEQAPKHGEGRLQYRIGGNDHPDDGTNRPSPELHEAVHRLYRSWTKDGQAFPGLEATVRLEPDGQWRVAMAQLDPTARRRGDKLEEQLWQEVYGAREAFFVERFGPMPPDIQKLMNLTGVWPGGGLFAIDAGRAGGMGVCMSFGLTNFDMPATVRSSEARQTVEDGRRVFSSRIEPRVPRWLPPEVAGYGYEILILTPKPERWPLLPVSLLVQMEILDDVDLPRRVDEVGGVTVEALKIGDGTRTSDFLVEPALPPLPERIELPNGTMRLLVATRITREEMYFAVKNGRRTLADRLVEAGVGQMSILDRPSILKA